MTDPLSFFDEGLIECREVLREPRRPTLTDEDASIAGLTLIVIGLRRARDSWRRRWMCESMATGQLRARLAEAEALLDDSYSGRETTNLGCSSQEGAAGSGVHPARVAYKKPLLPMVRQQRAAPAQARLRARCGERHAMNDANDKDFRDFATALCGRWPCEQCPHECLDGDGADPKCKCHLCKERSERLAAEKATAHAENAAEGTS